MNKKLLISGGMLVLALGLAGCQQTPAASQKSPDQAIADAIKNASTIKSSSFNLALKGDINAPQGQTPAKVGMDITLSGNADSTLPKEPKLNMKISGSVTADQDSGKGDAEVRLDKNALYAVINSATGTGNFTIPAEASQFIGKWWKLPIPPGAFDQAATKYLQDDSTLTPQEKQVKDYFESGKFLTAAKYVGSEGNADHYSATLDKKGLADFLVMASESQGTKLTDAEKTDMQTQLMQLDMTLDMYVDRTSGMITRVAGPVTFKDAKTGANASFTFDVSLSDFNKPVTVEVPPNAMEIPGMGGAAAMPTDDGSGAAMTAPATSATGATMAAPATTSADGSETTPPAGA